jgi:hypothetical protein
MMSALRRRARVIIAMLYPYGVSRVLMSRVVLQEACVQYDEDAVIVGELRLYVMSPA